MVKNSRSEAQNDPGTQAESHRDFRMFPGKRALMEDLAAVVDFS